MSEQSAHALLALYHQLITLKQLPRSGWLQRGVAGAESIADHSFGVTLLALLIGDGIPELNRGRLLAIAVLHDLAETLLTDLPSSARILLGADIKHQAEQRAIEHLLAPLPDQHDYSELWNEYATGSSPEARLVKGIDRLETLAQALAYERAGSRALDEFWQHADHDWSDEFPILRQLALLLIAQRRS